MIEPPQPRSIQPRGLLLRLVPWVLALAAGAAFGFTRAVSQAVLDGLTVAAAITLAWYVLESARWLISALCPPNREVVRIYLLPRLICTALGLAIAYLLNLPLLEGILVAYIATIVLETGIRIGLRRFAPTAAQRADLYVVAPHIERKTRMGAGRACLTAITAFLLVVAFSLASWVYVARETVLDARILTQNLHTSGLYSALIRAAGEAAQEAALEQRGNARQVAELLTEDDIRLAEQWALPEPWTTTWLQESLAVTLAWMQTTGEQRVPPILIPVADIERHIKDAASLLLDRHLATLPTCTPDMAATAYCRPSGMSVPAYAATYKLKDMAIADEILDLIPAELDLSTAVALYGRPFIEPLNDLDHARSALHALNQGLSLAGLLCLVLLALLWLLCSVTPKSRQHWLGATLLALALVAWAASYAAYALLPQWFIPQVSKELPANLSMPLEGFAGATLATAQNRIAAAALILAGLGLLLLWAPLLAPHQEAWTRPITTPQAARTGVILLAVASLLYVLYARTGERLYVRASQLYRDQDITAASALYRQIDRFYPFRITGRTGAGNAGSFVDHARRALYVSQLYLDAQAAFEVGEWQTAVQHDEALLLTQPSLSLRDRVQARLFEALIRWARSLEAGGQRERALDRYRFVRDEGLGRGQQVDEQPVRIHPTIGTLYIDWGDELKSQDPEAALATYRRALADTDDPGVWALAEQQMIDTYCAWSRQFREAGDAQRASRICIEFGTEFPALASYSCAACTP